MLLRAWVAFECRHGYQAPPPVQGGPSIKLSTEHRPQCVGDWIQRARRADWRPAIPNVEKFFRLFEMWYKANQPLWRIVDDDDG